MTLHRTPSCVRVRVDSKSQDPFVHGFRSCAYRVASHICKRSGDLILQIPSHAVATFSRVVPPSLSQTAYAIYYLTKDDWYLYLD
ncbi:hypothetical protein V8C37DRAFT_384558 [Trichoderma ceciliae]